MSTRKTTSGPHSPVVVSMYSDWGLVAWVSSGSPRGRV